MSYYLYARWFVFILVHMKNIPDNIIPVRVTS